MMLTPICLRDASRHEHLAWAQGMTLHVPDAVASALRAMGNLDGSGNAVLGDELPPVSPTAAESVRLRRAFVDSAPTASRLPFSYQFVPSSLRSALAGVMGRLQRRRAHHWASFPGWPLDLSADFVSDLASRPTRRSGPCPVLLTHDLDSPEGLRNVVSQFIAIEETVGARSLSFVVPCSWPIDHGLLAELTQRGHLIGIHGYDHSGRTPYTTSEARRLRVRAAQPLVERYRISGYRAPSLLRTRELLRELAALYQFDSSIPTSGGPFPSPNNGCATARPFQLEGIWELPLSMPRDGSLRFLGYTPGEIVRVWIDCARRIAQSGGVVVLLTHCEQRFSGNRVMLAAYRDFLEFVAHDRAFAFGAPDWLPKRAARAG